MVALFIATEALQRALGDAGTYSIAALAAVVDVDAVTLALARDAARGTLAAETAQRAIALAVLVNTAAKATMAVALVGPKLLGSVSAALGAAVVAGALTGLATL